MCVLSDKVEELMHYEYEVIYSYCLNTKNQDLLM